MTKKSDVINRLAKTDWFKKESQKLRDAIEDKLGTCDDLGCYVDIPRKTSRIVISDVIESYRTEGEFVVEFFAGTEEDPPYLVFS